MEKKKVLLVYDLLIPSVYLCGYTQLRFLSEKGTVGFRAKQFAGVTKKDILWADVVLFIRNDSEEELWLAKQCRAAGKYLIYVLDDDLLHVPGYISSSSHYENPLVLKRIESMMQVCDCFASPSDKLIEKYKERFSHTFRIAEPSLAQIHEKKPHADGKVHIGFAGSVDRKKDVDDILGEVLEEILSKYNGRVCVEIFGPETEFSKKHGIKTYPYADDYMEYQALMRKINWDIGLAPMPNSPFHQCKHYNKLIEYAGFGIAGVYSAVLPYAGVIENGVNGMICENTKSAWVAAISELIENADLRKYIQAQCVHLAKDKFSLENTAAQFQEELLSCPVGSSFRSSMHFFSIRRCMVRCADFIRRVRRAVLRRIVLK